ncbi:hypothetical protein [Paraliomyxa miuraensis]|uniref:hypothetical protein n=1 Tax=Paraliomyxa miuraensis TaxID=376150 RepID=UPI00225A3083|nr:hypothetical protein [Paraliomyxa miuraensis]MCX4245625.1 hypothetical protein [Paraliomyxa miuraensis]
MIRSLLALFAVSCLGPACIIITSDDSGDDETDHADEGGRPSGADETGPQYCQIGSEGCACTTGGKCNDPFLCNTNLNICVADLCPVGTEGCACTPMGACDPGLTCASDFCVDLGCPIGSEACPCTEGGACDPGLECYSGYCVDPGS